MSEDKDFKVIDKRGSKGDPTKGKGFEMKEGDKQSVSPGQLDFSTLSLSFATGALINLGVAPDPQTGKVSKNIEIARQNIEILTILQDKTKGNLTAEEAKLLENVLAEVRIRFVEATK